MNPTYFDMHAHVQFPEFDADRVEVLKRAKEAGVGMINVGTGRETSEQAVRLAEEDENTWAIVGLHPTHTEGENFERFDFDYFKLLAQNKKVVGIGECGFDFFHFQNREDARMMQMGTFESQIRLALEVDKPLMLHIRDGYKESIEVLKNWHGVRGNVHFFAGNVEEAKLFLELGFTLSFTGAITYKNSEGYHEVIRYAPLKSIMCETDCPFVAPVPYRGERNEPVFVIEVYKKIAEIKNVPLEQVINQVRENVRRVFSI